MAISDLPGYLQGYVFQNKAQYFDPAKGYFKNQAGPDLPGSRAVVEVGTPQFVTVNAVQGVEFDNTWQVWFNCPISLRGTIIVVFGAPGFTPAGTENLSLVKGQSSTNFAANQHFPSLGYFSGQFNHRIALANAASVAQDNKGDSGIYASALGINEPVGTKRVELLDSAGNLLTGATTSDDNVGDPIINGGADYTYYNQIIGALTADQTNVTPLASGNTLTLCELHFFSELLTEGDTTAVEAELVALEAIYG